MWITQLFEERSYVEVDDDIINAYLCGAVEMKYIMKKKLKGLD